MDTNWKITHGGKSYVVTDLAQNIAGTILRARIDGGGWAKFARPTDDGGLVVEFGDKHHGVEERALGHYVVHGDGTVSKYVGV